MLKCLQPVMLQSCLCNHGLSQLFHSYLPLSVCLQAQ